MHLLISRFAQGEWVACFIWESDTQSVFWDHCVKLPWDGGSLKPVRLLPLTLKAAKAQSRIINFYQQHTLGLVPGAFRSGLALEVLQSAQSISVSASLLFQILT